MKVEHLGLLWSYEQRTGVRLKVNKEMAVKLVIYNSLSYSNLLNEILMFGTRFETYLRLCECIARSYFKHY